MKKAVDVILGEGHELDVSTPEDEKRENRRPERCLLCGERAEGHKLCDDEHDDGTEGPCGAPGPHGRVCTRADGHASLLHAAHESGAVIDVWSDVASIGDEARLLTGELATLRGEARELREQVKILRAAKERFERGYFEAHRRIDVEVAARQEAEGMLARCLSLVLPLPDAKTPGKYDEGFALLHDAVKGRRPPPPRWVEVVEAGHLYWRLDAEGMPGPSLEVYVWWWREDPPVPFTREAEPARWCWSARRYGSPRAEGVARTQPEAFDAALRALEGNQ